MGHLRQSYQRIGFATPLRYPGGKRKLLPFFRDLIDSNDLRGACYIEPFAGGAGLALSLLLSGYVGMVHLNDLDVAVYSFWKAVLSENDELCARIENASLDMDTWRHQRNVIEQPEQYSELDVAFATLFLNRTNRSGILRGGVIGGKGQEGEWRMDARFNKRELVRRIQIIGTAKDHIRVHNQEASQFLQCIPEQAGDTEKCIIYADPPYYAKGPTLYFNHYGSGDHRRLAETMRNLRVPWVVSYDDVSKVYELYQGMSYLRYQLHYTAQMRKRGGEVMFFHGLTFPLAGDATRWLPMRAAVGNTLVQD